jgi:2'-5' RNA ligase
MRSPLNKFALSKMLKTYFLPELMNQNVKEVVLFKSTLTSSGPIYEALKRIPLAQNN